MTADMHTHSHHSHDSSCPVEDMCLAQIEKGTDIMAVTDHFNNRWHDGKDSEESINASFVETVGLQEKYKDKITILTGVEMAEYADDWERASALIQKRPFDVIIGSVHFVGCREPYSQTVFSSLSDAQISRYLQDYFEDLHEMAQKADYDILAHLTCPLRYITGKYGRQIDLKLFADKITEILQTIIDRQKALEINTSAYSALDDFMPGEEIVRRYYEMGGRLITLGSDAHIPQNASTHFEEAKQMLKNIGFTTLYYYQNRTPVGYAF